MEIFRDTNFDFLGKKWPFIILSLVLTGAGIVSLIAKGGPRYGIDFKGGTLLYVKFADKPSEESVRTALAKKIAGEISVVAVQGTNELMIQTELKDDKDLQTTRQTIEETLAQLFGSQQGKADFAHTSATALYDRLVMPLQRGGVFIDDADLRKLSAATTDFRDKQKGGILSNFDELKAVPGMTDQILNVIKAEFWPGKYQIRNTEVVGPKVGSELRMQALLATIYALAGMLIYVGLRFEFVFGLAAVIAVAHDTIMTVGLFSILDKEITLTVVAALLTLVGYSMNEQIVVFDRIRENMGRGRKENMEQIINRSINETISRTVMTAGLTFLTVLSLFVFGGQVLNNFALALVLGIILATYSAMFVSSPILVFAINYFNRRGGKTGGGLAAKTAQSAERVALKK